MTIHVLIMSSDVKRLNFLKSLFQVFEFDSQVNVLNSIDAIDSSIVKKMSLLLLDSEFNNADACLAKIISINHSFGLVAFGNTGDEVKSQLKNVIELPSELKLIPTVNAIKKILESQKMEIPLVTKKQNFFPIKISQLYRIFSSPCDVYLKINELKYVKCIHANEDSIQEMLSKYKDKGFQYLYLKKEDYYSCYDFFFKDILPSEEEFINSKQTKEIYYSNSQQVIYELISDLGISENVIQVSEELIQDICKEYKNSELSSLFEKFKYSKERYIFDHSTMTSMFSIAICTNFEWRNTEIYKKLTMAAMYHDFGFMNPKLALIEQDHDEINKLSKSFKREVLEHPEVMAKKLSNFKGVSGETISMVLKHHEAHGEHGYPKKLSSAHLSVLECIFMAAHEFTNQIYRIAFRQDKMHLAIQRTLEYLEGGNMKAVREPFLKMIKSDYLKQQ